MAIAPQRTEIALRILLAGTLLLVGCGRGASTPASSGDPEADRRAEMRVGAEDGNNQKDPRTLYERIGGRRAIVALVDDLTPRVVEDPRINFQRNNVKISWTGKKYEPWSATDENTTRFKNRMVEFLVLAAGGPAEYAGRDMRTAHANMHISNSEFDAMVGDIKVSMDRLRIGNREKRDLIAIIETTRKQIVEKQ